MRILLIEDDTVLGAAIRDQIAGDGQSVDWEWRNMILFCLILCCRMAVE
jgi:DNA-binding response OmpR family regulator